MTAPPSSVSAVTSTATVFVSQGDDDSSSGSDGAHRQAGTDGQRVRPKPPTKSQSTDDGDDDKAATREGEQRRSLAEAEKKDQAEKIEDLGKRLNIELARRAAREAHDHVAANGR